jgi:hypothetical protein
MYYNNFSFFIFFFDHSKEFLESQVGCASSSITHVSLVPLTVTQLLADLHLSLRPKNEADVQSLAHIIAKKAKGVE